MTCPLHTAPQSFCARCAEVTAMSSSQMTVVSWPNEGWTALIGQPSPSHDASAARIAGLEANVNEKLATIAALRAQLHETEIRRCNASATITDITDALGITGGHDDNDDIDDDKALAAVREYELVQRGVFDRLHDEVAQLRSAESVAIAAARIASLAAALRKALADVDPKAMSTYEQQQARREARALLEEVA